MQFDLGRFIEFCRSKPADKEYDQLDPQACALAQFGYPNVDHEHLQGIPREVYRAAALCSGATFGALTDRLSSACRIDDGQGEGDPSGNLLSSASPIEPASGLAAPRVNQAQGEVS